MTVVLDASALLAHLKAEPGGEVVRDILRNGAHISAANWAEVLTKLADAGEDPNVAVNRMHQQGLLNQALVIHPLDDEQALRVAQLRLPTRSAGLSLADRACLALAETLSLPAYTADRSWATLQLTAQPHLSR